MRASAEELRGSGAWLLLLASAFAVAAGGLVYELALATLTSYLLGEHVLHYSVTIGAFLFAMGAGSYASRFVHEGTAEVFVCTEAILGLVGGLGSLGLAVIQAFGLAFYPALAVVVLATGALVGLELPLLVRLVRHLRPADIALAEVLGLDYLGSLAGALLFPLVLLPALDVHRATLAFGLVNVGVGWIGLRLLRPAIRKPARAAALLAAATVGLVAVIPVVPRFVRWSEAALFDDAVVLARSTAYQRMVLTRWRDEVRFFLDGQLQLSSADAHRYHEALVHPAMTAVDGPVRALVLGGGDGLVVHELLRYGPRVRSITVVDLDPGVTELFRTHPMLREIGGASLEDPRVRIVHQDAMRFVQEGSERYEVVLVDLPDPDNPSLARLYTTAFYRLALRRLSDGGALAAQATSAMHTPHAFWCVIVSLEAASGGDDAPIRRQVRPYHAYVPTFGDWGFALVTASGGAPQPRRLPTGLRFLDEPQLGALFRFPADMPRRDVRPSTLADPRVLRHYREDYDRTVM